jgi:hypothetical protein
MIFQESGFNYLKELLIYHVKTRKRTTRDRQKERQAERQRETGEQIERQTERQTSTSIEQGQGLVNSGFVIVIKV